jgi:hypothetical protein
MSSAFFEKHLATARGNCRDGPVIAAHGGLKLLRDEILMDLMKRVFGLAIWRQIRDEALESIPLRAKVTGYLKMPRRMTSVYSNNSTTRSLFISSTLSFAYATTRYASTWKFVMEIPRSRRKYRAMAPVLQTASRLSEMWGWRGLGKGTARSQPSVANTTTHLQPSHQFSLSSCIFWHRKVVCHSSI